MDCKDNTIWIMVMAISFGMFIAGMIIANNITVSNYQRMACEKGYATRTVDIISGKTKWMWLCDSTNNISK